MKIFGPAKKRHRALLGGGAEGGLEKNTKFGGAYLPPAPGSQKRHPALFPHARRRPKPGEKMAGSPLGKNKAQILKWRKPLPPERAHIRKAKENHPKMGLKKNTQVGKGLGEPKR